jgi:hypothetical protein
VVQIYFFKPCHSQAEIIAFYKRSNLIFPKKVLSVCKRRRSGVQGSRAIKNILVEAIELISEKFSC